MIYESLLESEYLSLEFGFGLSCFATGIGELSCITF